MRKAAILTVLAMTLTATGCCESFRNSLRPNFSNLNPFRNNNDCSTCGYASSGSGECTNCVSGTSYVTKSSVDAGKK